MQNIDFEFLRESYRPAQIKILFVGESPPASGKFFYIENSLLYHATKESFLQALPYLNQQTPFLKTFQDLGCYLEDLCETPVNHLDNSTRARERAKSLPSFREKIKQISPKIVIVVMKQITPYVQQALDAENCQAVLHNLPFPRRHRQQYVSELKQLLRTLYKEGVIK
jgi:hypothetical protein